MLVLVFLLLQQMIAQVPETPKISAGEQLFRIAQDTFNSLTGELDPYETEDMWAADLLDIVYDFLFFEDVSAPLFEEPLEEIDWTEFRDLPVIADSDSANVKKAKALKMLHVAAYQEEHQGALGALGDIYLYSLYKIPRNATIAFEHYSALSRTGNATGYRMLGLMTASGIGKERDYAKALVYLSFAAIDNDIQANYALGYWHHAGVAVPKVCEKALFYYERVVDAEKETYLQGPPGGRWSPREKVSLSKKAGGVYGKGASGSGSTAKSRSSLRELDMIMLYRLQAESGDPVAQFMIGQYYYQGTQSLPRDYQKAFQFFSMAAKQHPGMNVLQQEDVSSSLKQAALAASQSAGYLGEMYWRGEGVAEDVEKARKWFERGAAQENAASLNGLGIMHLEGQAGFEVNEAQALYYFEQAARKDHADGMVNLSKLLMSIFINIESQNPEHIRIHSLLEKSASKGHPLAMYYLGKLYKVGYGDVVPMSCRDAVKNFKMLAEKWSWNVPQITWGYNAYMSGDYETAFVNYALTAEMGFELSQLNAAWILDSGRYVARKPSRLIHTENLTELWDPYVTALPLWIRAANQGHIDARVKVGDYFFYGLGINKNGTEAGTKVSEEPDFPVGYLTQLSHSIAGWFALPGAKQYETNYAEAALHYSNAADHYQSFLAMYNLGYMHEYGLGVEQVRQLTKDFYLAKRYYDLAKTVNPASNFPVSMSMARMRFKWLLESIMNPEFEDDDVPPIPDEESEPEPDDSKALEAVLFSILCVVAGFLLYLRTKVLNAQNQPARPNIPNAQNAPASPDAQTPENAQNSQHLSDTGETDTIDADATRTTAE